MAFKAVLKIFGVKMDPETVAKFAFIEIFIMAILWLALIVIRYTTNMLSHELFLELMVILGFGMAFDHYAVSVLGIVKK